MKPAGPLAALLLLSLSGVPRDAAAGTISLETTIRCRVEEERLLVTVIERQKGDEPAYDVQVHATAEGRTVSSGVMESLPPGGVFRTESVFDLSGEGPGTYAVTVRTDYADANRYAFSALAAATYVLGSPAPADLLGKIEELTLSKGGTLRTVWKNLDDTEKEIRVDLHLPREISCDRPSAALRLGPREERGAEFPLSNFSALPGSAYGIVATAGVSEGGVHRVFVARGTVRIAKDEGPLARYRVLWIAVAVLLVLALIAVQFLRK